MAGSFKENKPKNKTNMHNHDSGKKADKKDNEKKSEQGAFTKKPWNESTTSEKIQGVGLTAAAAAVGGALIYNTLKS